MVTIFIVSSDKFDCYHSVKSDSKSSNHSYPSLPSHFPYAYFKRYPTYFFLFFLFLFFFLLLFAHFRVFHISKFPQVSRTLLSILTVLSNAVIWIVSTRPPTSKSSRPFNNLFVIVPKAPIPIDTIVTFMFHSFFNSLERSRYLSFFFHSFSLILWSAGTANSTIMHILFFFVNYYKVWSSGRN